MSETLGISELLSAQKAIGKVTKNRKNPFFNNAPYADYEAVLDAVKKPLNDNGFAIIHQGVTENGKDYLKTILLHTSGANFSSLFLVTSNDNPQKFLSQWTYGKRANLSSLVGLASDDDDDGNSAAKSTHTPHTSNPPPPAKTSPNAQEGVELAPGMMVKVFTPTNIKRATTKTGKAMAWIEDGKASYGCFDQKAYELAEQAMNQGKAIKMVYTSDGKYTSVKSIALAKPDPIDAVLVDEEPTPGWVKENDGGGE